MSSRRHLRKSEALPQWATRRRSERATLGGRIAKIAKRMGTPLMPWQQLVADVGLELNEEGRMAYREVLVTVPRQSGKTAMLLVVEMDRCTMWDDPQRVIYTAQTGSDARKKLLEDQVPLIEKSVWAKLVKHVHRAQGNEGVLFRSGSRISVAASSKDSGHGFTVDLGVLDECWNDEDDRREQAMLPAMNTRPDAQIWLTSTMGTDRSVYLNRKVDTGRHAVATDKGSGIAYFEWSIPDEADIENPEAWWEYMPALGWTISENVIAHAFETMEEAEWRRAYGNQRTTLEHDRVFPAVLWEAVCRPSAEVGRDADVIFALDVLPDRSFGAIVASDGQTVELIEHRPGTGWMVERAQRLLESWHGVLAIDGGGPAASIAEDLETLSVPVERMGGAEVAAACACMYDAIADAKVTFRTDGAFETAIDGLAQRPIGDRFVWSRSASRADITPFMAATLAFERATHAEVPPLAGFRAFD